MTNKTKNGKVDPSLVIAFSLPTSIAHRLSEFIKNKSTTKNRSVVIRNIIEEFLNKIEKNI